MKISGYLISWGFTWLEKKTGDVWICEKILSELLQLQKYDLLFVAYYEFFFIQKTILIEPISVGSFRSIDHLLTVFINLSSTSKLAIFLPVIPHDH